LKFSALDFREQIRTRQMVEDTYEEVIEGCPSGGDISFP
jgi:hypothetical protein